MILFDAADLTIYDKNGENVTIGLSALQILVVLKALGIQIPKDVSDETAYQAFNDTGLREVVLPLLNQNPIIQKIKPVVMLDADEEEF